MESSHDYRRREEGRLEEVPRDRYQTEKAKVIYFVGYVTALVVPGAMGT
jgi:hypothetical protein